MKRTLKGLTIALAVLTPVLLIGGVGMQQAHAATGPADDRLNSTPTGWWQYNSISPSALGTALSNNGARLTDLRVETASPLTFAATMVKNSGSYNSGWWWYYGQTVAQVNSLLSSNNARLISATPYTTSSGTRWAVVMVPNTGTNAKSSIWYGNVSSSTINTAVSNGWRLIRLESILIGSTRYYTGIFVANTGTDNLNWHYYYGQTSSQVNSQLSANSSRLIDIDRRSDGLYDIVMYRNTGAGAKAWFWYINYSAAGLLAKANQLGSRVIDLNTYVIGSRRYYAGIFLDNVNALTGKMRNLLYNAPTSGNWGFQMKPLGLTPTASLQANVSYEPASALKVLYHLVAFRRIAAGTSSYSTSITYYSSSNGSCPDRTGPTATTTLTDALTQMMVNSNNNMTMAVLDYLGKAYVQSYANSIGMSHTVINHYIGCPTLPTLNTTSIGDITRVYEGVENGTLLNSNYRSAFYARMLNETNYQQKFQAYLCPIVNQEAAKLGKSSTVAQNFCNAVTWKAKGGDYVMGNPNGGNPLEFHGGLSNYGFPVKTTPGGAITSYKHWIWGTYIDHTVYSSSSNKTAISNARTNAQTAALIGPIDQALTTW